jgi:hypothetical protein
VYRPLVVEQSVAVGVGDDHPPVARPRHHQRKLVADRAVGVHVGRGGGTQANLAEHAAVVRPAGKARHAAEALQSVSQDFHRTVAVRHDLVQLDPTLSGEITQVEHFALTRARRSQTRHCWIQTAVENRDQHPAAVVRGVLHEEMLRTHAAPGHEPGEHGELRLEHGLTRLEPGLIGFRTRRRLCLRRNHAHASGTERHREQCRARSAPSK